MFKFIERLRQESEPHRRRTALISALSITGVIFIAWLMLVTSGSIETYHRTADVISTSTSPVAAARAALLDTVGAFKDFVGMFKEAKVIFDAASSSSPVIASSTIPASLPR